MTELGGKLAGHCPMHVERVSNLHRVELTNLCHLDVSILCTFDKGALGNSVANSAHERIN